jgi:hypothetical protein
MCGGYEMSRISKENASVMAKYTVERQNAPIAGMGIIYTYADASHSFMTKDVQYFVTFLIGEKQLDVQMEKSMYERMDEGDKGILEHRGKEFINWKKMK